MAWKPFARIFCIGVLSLLLMGGVVLATQQAGDTPVLPGGNSPDLTVKESSTLPPALVGTKKMGETAPAFQVWLPDGYDYEVDKTQAENIYMFIYPDTSYYSYLAISQSKEPTTPKSWDTLTGILSQTFADVWDGTTDEAGYTTLSGQKAVYIKGHYYDDGPRTYTKIATYDSEGYFYQVFWLVDTKYYSTDKPMADKIITSINFGGSGSSCTGDLKSAFSVDVTKGKVPLKVMFTDKSSGCPTAYLYDFGDGSTSTDPNPTHTYYGIGSFLPKLTVTKNGVKKTTNLERNIEISGVSTQSWRVYKQQTSKPVFYLKTPPTAQVTYSQTSLGHETTFTDKTYGYVLLVTVLKPDLSGSGSTRDDILDVLKDFVEEDGGYIIESNYATLGGKPAVRLISTRSTEEGTLFTENILAAWYNGKIVEVNYLAPTKTYEKGLPTAMTAISTFKFI